MLRDNTTVTAPPRGFSQEEYEGRLQRIQRSMRTAQMDAMLLCTEADLRYFSGFLTQFWQSPTRPWFLLVPQSGKPVAVIPTIGLECMARTWIDDIRTWHSPHPTDDGVSLVLSTVHELCGASATVGIPMGRETHARIPINTLDSLRVQSNNINWIDAGSLISDTRMIKSEHEIEKIRHACGIANLAFNEVPAQLKNGTTERNLFTQFKINALQAGADDCVYLVGASGPGGYRDIISPPGDRSIVEGDIVILDTGCLWDGYHCDYDRNFAIGKADSASAQAYDIVWQATQIALDNAKPDMRCAELFKLMSDAMPGVNEAEANVGRLGHGLGMQLTEPPSFTDFDTTRLQPGMVLTLEPSLPYGDGMIMVHEENIVIRDHGAELLTTRAAEKLPVI